MPLFAFPRLFLDVPHSLCSCAPPPFPPPFSSILGPPPPTNLSFPPEALYHVLPGFRAPDFFLTAPIYQLLLASSARVFCRWMAPFCVGYLLTLCILLVPLPFSSPHAPAPFMIFDWLFPRQDRLMVRKNNGNGFFWDGIYMVISIILGIVTFPEKGLDKSLLWASLDSAFPFLSL